MSVKRRNHDLGMLLGISIIVSVIVSAAIARLMFQPDPEPRRNIEDYILKKYSIERDAMAEDEELEYEIFFDQKTGKRVIREKKPEFKKEAFRAPVPDFVFLPSSATFCSR